MIRPSVPQLPPRGLPIGLVQSTTGAPPARSTRSNLSLIKKPMDLPSGDQKGRIAPSVPASGRLDLPSSDRTQRPLLGPEVTAYATILPSGDNAPTPLNWLSSGGASSRRSGS